MSEENPNPKTQTAREATQRQNPVYYFLLDTWKRDELPDEEIDLLLCEFFQSGRPVFLKTPPLPPREIGYLIAAWFPQFVPYPMEQSPLLLTTEELADRVGGDKPWA